MEMCKGVLGLLRACLCLFCVFRILCCFSRIGFDGGDMYIVDVDEEDEYDDAVGKFLCSGVFGGR